MTFNKLPGVSLVLAGILIFTACHPVKITSIEKRRYQKGYHVQMMHHPSIPDVLPSETLMAKSDVAGSEDTVLDPQKQKKGKGELKKVRTVLKELRKGRSPEQIKAAVSDIVDKAIILDNRKNIASLPNQGNEAKKQGAFKPIDALEFGTGQSAIVLLVVLAILLILLMENVLVSILVAVLLTLLIIWLLRELELIH